MLHTTLCFLVRDEQVLLGLKKRRFGTGKWNGAGGKLLEGESVIESVAREVNEELGVVVLPENFESVATLNFNYTDNPDWTQECDVFIVRQWQDEPVESEELKPQWYAINKLPFDEMWIDDPHWLPLVLAGKKIKAEFHFNKDGTQIIDFKVVEVAL